MIPEQRPSTTPVPSGWVNPPQTRPFNSFHWGPVALNDASQGLFVKLWTVRADGNDILLSAPGYPEAVLLTRTSEVRQVSLAFDQNGQPCVAFVEDDDSAHLYWYDSTIPGFDVMDLPSTTITPRLTMDDGRTFMNGRNDIILMYVRAGSLYYRQQRDRFEDEYFLQADVVELHHVSMSAGLRLQWLYKGPGAPAAPFLADVVSDLVRRSGVPPEAIDVSELYGDRVQGLRVAIDEGLDDPLQWLSDVFMFDKSQYDRKLYFPKRGRDVEFRIPYSDLVRRSPAALEVSIRDETKLPREVHINHLDPDGGFAKNKQMAGRRSNLVNARGKETIDTQVVLTADQAAGVAWTKLKMHWNELIDYKFEATIKWTELTVGMVGEVEDAKGTWHRLRLEERNEDGSVLAWEAVQDAGIRAYNTAATGNTLPPPTSTTPGLVGETRLEILNIPVQRDQDDELGLYIAAAGSSGAWQGYTLLYSVDDGTSYVEAFTSDTPCILGDTLTDLPEATYEYQSTQTVEVTTNFPLSSISYAQLLQRQNRCVIGDEVLQFQTVTLLGMVGSLYHYRLSGLVRGKFHTPAEFWPLGTRFVLLDGAVVFAQLQRAFLGVDLAYKAVSVGHTVDETIPLYYLYEEGISQTEWPVAFPQAERVGADVHVSWIGCARLGLDTAPFHSKYFAGFRVKFSDGHTIETTSQSAVYASAPGSVDVEICALNTITGEGPYSAPITV